MRAAGAIGIEEFEGGVMDYCCRIGTNRINCALKTIRQSNIVSIEKCDPVSCSCKDSCISRFCDALILLADISNSIAIFLTDLASFICRTIIYNDDFMCRHSLCQRTVERLSKKSTRIAGRDHNSDTNRTLHRPSLFSSFLSKAKCGEGIKYSDVECRYVKV